MLQLRHQEARLLPNTYLFLLDFEFRSPISALLWVCVPSLRLPSTLTPLGYVISNTESPGIISNEWFFRTVAVYARWCHTMFGSPSWFGRHSRLPNTAHIIWELPAASDGAGRTNFSLSTTLPETVIHPRPHKNKARLIRVKALADADQTGLFSILMNREASALHRYQWGNCAETMNLLRFVLPSHRIKLHQYHPPVF